MYHRYILSQEALDAVKPLQKKIKEIGKGEDYGYLHQHLYGDGADEFLKEVQDTYLESAPDYFRERFKAVLGAMQDGTLDKTRHQWAVRQPNETDAFAELHNNETLIVSGYVASLLLEKDDFWNHEEHGMKSPTDWFGTVGAAVISQRETNPLPGSYKYTSEYEGQTYETRIGGDHDLDLEIWRINVTPKPAKNPYGNDISYRPVVSDDRHIVSANHSTESALFAAALKYIEQENIDIPCLRNGAEELLHEMTEKDPRIADIRKNGNLSGMPGVSMANFAHSIPINPKTYAPLWLLDKGFGANGYGIHLDEKRNFCISHTQQCVPVGMPALVIPPAEMNEFVRGLFLQSANHRGRTPLHVLASLLLYRHSERFEKDMARTNPEEAV